MSSAPHRGSSTRRTTAPALLGALALAVLAGVVALQVRGTAAGPAPSTRESLLAYEQELLPVVKDWGSIEVRGMRPAIADLRAGNDLGAPSVVAAQARAWRAALGADRDKLRRLPSPAGLQGFARMLDLSMERYLRATDRFLAATETTGAGRDRLIEQGVAEAVRGAQLYDEASALLQAARRAQGLPPSAAFPDKRGGAS